MAAGGGPSIRPDEAAELRRIAEGAARAGGEYALNAFGGPIFIKVKDDASDVSDIDLLVEQNIIERIRAERGGDAFIGEEGMAGRQDLRGARVTWVIDPIDGTRNFIRGVPLFTCSVAAMVDGWPVAGAVYDPVSRTMFAASWGGGAERNGERLEPPPAEAAGRGRVLQPVMAIPSAWREEGRTIVLSAIERSIVRSLGCATLHIVHVASGGFDAAYLNNCKLWDIAAAWLVLAESGGVATRPDGSALFPVDVARYAGQELPLFAVGPAVDVSVLGAGGDRGAKSR